MNETETRAELIDKQLAEAGWTTEADANVRVRREYPINDGEILANGQRRKALKADYVLMFRNIKLAVIEAKRNELDVSEGVAQAKLYAAKLSLAYSFAANGKEIYQICHRNGKEGKVDRFPTPEELWQLCDIPINDWLARFLQVPYKNIGGNHNERYYQSLAVDSAMKAISQKRTRILLTLATGSGKTFIAFQIVWKLFHSRWNMQWDGKRSPRILFLTDRNILANQAFNKFGAFAEDALVRITSKEIRRRQDVPKNGSIFFTIFQTFMGASEASDADTNNQYHYGQYDSDFFDMVIIDECHRGGANDESSWRDILNHFDKAVHLGLTATPKHQENVNTYEYFGDPVHVYSLKEGIEDGFLTPFKVKRIQNMLDTYQYSPDDDILDGKSELDKDRVYVEKDFNKRILIEERERRRVQTMLAHINQKEKTLVFCANQAHAARIRDFINQQVKSNDGDYCVRVTANDGEIGESHLRTFQDNEKSIPTILTSSRKLSTGIDATNIRYIVLLRPIKSMIEFKQIIGRGTRIHEGKNYFTVLDFVNAYEHFNDPEWDGKAMEVVDTDATQDAEGTQASNRNIPADKEPAIAKESSSSENQKHGQGQGAKNTMIVIDLGDNNKRTIKPIIDTHFYLGGKLVSVEEFMKYLFSTQFPKLFLSEEKLRQLWANPITRQDLLEKLADNDCSKADLLTLKEAMANGNDCDLFDVLAYIAYARKPITRRERVKKSENKILNFLNHEEREFIRYVLENYIIEGSDELNTDKLSVALEGKYGSIASAQEKLGELNKIKSTFTDFQQHLYKSA